MRKHWHRTLRFLNQTLEICLLLWPLCIMTYSALSFWQQPCFIYSTGPTTYSAAPQSFDFILISMFLLTKDWWWGKGPLGAGRMDEQSMGRFHSGVWLCVGDGARFISGQGIPFLSMHKHTVFTGEMCALCVTVLMDRWTPPHSWILLSLWAPFKSPFPWDKPPVWPMGCKGLKDTRRRWP